VAHALQGQLLPILGGMTKPGACVHPRVARRCSARKAGWHSAHNPEPRARAAPQLPDTRHARSECACIV